MADESNQLLNTALTGVVVLAVADRLLDHNDHRRRNKKHIIR